MMVKSKGHAESCPDPGSHARGHRIQMISNETNNDDARVIDDPNSIENNKNNNNNACGAEDGLPPTPTTKSSPHAGRNNNDNVVDVDGAGERADGNNAGRGVNDTCDEHTSECITSKKPCGSEDGLPTTPTTESPLHKGDGNSTGDNISDAGDREYKVRWADERGRGQLVMRQASTRLHHNPGHRRRRKRTHSWTRRTWVDVGQAITQARARAARRR